MTHFSLAAPVVVVDTPQRVYLASCVVHGVRANSGVLSSLTEFDSFSSIVALNFSRNCLGRMGLIPLISVIERCCELRELALTDNYLVNDAVVMLCDALEKLPHLRSLQLGKNPISYPSGKRLEALVARSQRLRHLDISGTLMNPALASKVMRLAAIRNRPTQLSAAEVQPAALSGSTLGNGHCESGDFRPRPLVSNCGPTEDHCDSPGALSLSSAPRSTVTKDLSPVEAICAKPPPTKVVRPEDPWYAMETVWSVAADAEHQADGGRTFHGLLCIMTQMRRDIP